MGGALARRMARSYVRYRKKRINNNLVFVADDTIIGQGSLAVETFQRLRSTAPFLYAPVVLPAEN